MLTVLVLYANSLLTYYKNTYVLILHKYCQNRYLMFYANIVEKSRRSTNKHKYSGENSGKNLQSDISNVFSGYLLFILDILIDFERRANKNC